MSRDLTKIFASLNDETKPLNFQLLRNFSDLSEPELAQFKKAWAGLSDNQRLALIQALVAMAEDNVAYHYNAIFVLALDDADSLIRALAIDGLWEAQQPQILDRLLQMIVHDDAVAVRAAAVLALNQFVIWGELGEIPSDLGARATEMLWDVYHNPLEPVRVRRRALEGLASSGRPGISRLIENAYHGDDLSMQSSALFAMGRSGLARWIPTLLPELSNETAALRMEAVRALGELEAEDAVDPMLRMLDVESDVEVRLAILEALGKIGGEKAKLALELAADSEDEAEAEMAELALETLFAGVNDLSELIDEVLGVKPDEPEEEPAAASDAWGDFFEDPLESEIQRLLDEDERY